jgi:mRNA-degrading endonuclease toxin of MazEF toxin-antitoxin module
MADQIAAVGKQRLKSKLTTLSLEDVRAVERAIRVQLGLTAL